MKKIHHLSMASITLFLTACGGGGGGGISNTNTYDLTALDTKNYTINYSGYVMDNGTKVNLTGSEISTYLGTESVSGYETSKKRENLAVLFDGGMSSSVESFEYLYFGIPIKTEEEGVTCTFDGVPFALPTDAPVGYISDQIYMSCDDGSSSEAIVNVKAVSSENAKVIVYGSGNDIEDGAYTWTTEYIVDPTMQILSYAEEYSAADGHKISVHSTAIVQ